MPSKPRVFTPEAEKNRAKVNRWAAAHREELRARRKPKNRARTLMNRYGMTLEDFSAMLAAQGGGCAVCRKLLDPNPERHTRNHIDHDHTRHVVRGILCRTCNIGLGYFGDNVALLEAALAYLKK